MNVFKVKVLILVTLLCLLLSIVKVFLSGSVCEYLFKIVIIRTTFLIIVILFP